MNRRDRLKLSLAFAIFAFFIQIALLVVQLQFVDESTGQFRLGAEIRFKFVDETTRQFVLVSQLQRLPEEILRVTELSAALAAVCYIAAGVFDRFRPAAMAADPDGLDRPSENGD